MKSSPSNPYGDAMRRVFELANIDYGRVDFGLVGGQPQIYEINSNPDLKLNPKTSPAPRRNESSALFKSNYLEALRALDTSAPGSNGLKKSRGEPGACGRSGALRLALACPCYGSPTRWGGEKWMAKCGVGGALNSNPIIWC